IGIRFHSINFGPNVPNLFYVCVPPETSPLLSFPSRRSSDLFGTVPGLSAGPVKVDVYNQTGPGVNSWGLVGSTSLTVNDTRPPPSVSSITPDPIDLASPPASFTITDNDTADLGFLLTVVYFLRHGTNLGQVRVTSVTSPTLFFPFPTPQRPFVSVPSLHDALPILDVYNQTGPGVNSWGLVGSTSLTVNDTRPPPSVSSITPNPIDLASPPASFTITGSGFAN